jgi:hypothetical protein
MQKQYSIFKFEVLNTIFIFISGTILHFTFKWSNNNILVGTFSSINESTWEHLKLLFFPMLITAIIGHFYLKIASNYLCIKTKAIIIALLFTIVFFYTYTGVIGTNISIIDIGSFYVSVILSQYYAYKKIKSNTSCNNYIAGIILFILFFCFIIFTFIPPHIGLFKDPLTELFGI